MKKSLIIVSILLIALLGTIFVACDDNQSNIVNYYLNEDGNLIAVFEDGSENNLGVWAENIINSLGSISINNGYYVIDGIQTEISEIIPLSYYLDSDLNLIAKYRDNSIKNLGVFTAQFSESVKTIKIDSNGFYIINDVKTLIKTKVPKSYFVDNDGYLVVVYIDQTEERLGKLTDSLGNGVETIGISDDGNYIVNGIETSIKATNVYTVTYDSGGGTSLDPIKVKEGQTINKPNVTRKGYTFDGWYCNDELWLFSSNRIYNDITLIAKWAANTYNVSFVSVHGDTPIDIEVVFDSDVTLPILSCSGYTFNGWTLESKIVADGKWCIDEDVTLEANWVPNNYVITLNPGTGSVESTTINVTYGEKFTLPVPTNSYGVFLGWMYGDIQLTDNKGVSKSAWSIADNATLTVDWTIEINSVDDLNKVNKYSNGEFKLMSDLVVSGKEWTPFNNFIGVFDGNGHKISGLTITNPNRQNIGLFGYTNGATIKNLTLEDVDINLSAVNRNTNIGGLIGNCDKTTVGGCKVIGTITIAAHSSEYNTYVGGLVGSSNTSNFLNNVNDIDINGQDVIGGIIGKISSSNAYNTYTISQNINNGNITSSNIAAGIIGVTSGEITITACSNRGNIIGTNYAAGIIAENIGSVLNAISISNCSNYGSITASADTSYAGGIIAYINFANIRNSCSIGNINAKTSVGGIAGYSLHPNVQKVYVAGNIDGTLLGTSEAGIIGNNVAGSSDAIVGDSIVFVTGCEYLFISINTGTLKNCYYNTTKGTCSTATYTTESFSKEFYTKTLFWSEKDWTFYEDSYPILMWEKEFVNEI